jgi:hypothetical protein
MAVPLTGVVGDLTNLIPSSSDLIQQVILGAGAGVVLAGIKSSGGQDILDPLKIFHKDAPAAAPNLVVGATVAASVFAAMPPATQQAMVAQGVHIVAG